MTKKVPALLKSKTAAKTAVTARKAADKPAAKANSLSENNTGELVSILNTAKAWAPAGSSDRSLVVKAIKIANVQGRQVSTLERLLAAAVQREAKLKTQLDAARTSIQNLSAGERALKAEAKKLNTEMASIKRNPLAWAKKNLTPVDVNKLVPAAKSNAASLRDKHLDKAAEQTAKAGKELEKARTPRKTSSKVGAIAAKARTKNGAKKEPAVATRSRARA